jgi:hypothetical protein
MSALYSFPATPQEMRNLAAAVAHNCACHTDGAHLIRCASHVMVLGATPADRRTLEGLLYVRRVLLPRLRAEEFDTPA